MGSPDKPNSPDFVAPSARDHAGLALLPVTLALRQPTLHEGPVTFDQTLTVDGRPRRMKVTLVPGDSGALPVHGDALVYLALLQLALQTQEPEDELLFQRGDVFDLLRWPSTGRYYGRLREALLRLTELTIRLDSALVARDGREYSKLTSASHLIDSFTIGSGRDAGCSLRWGGIVIEGFRRRDFKRLDWDLILALGNPLAAQLYRLIDRVTLSGDQSWEVDYRSLATALGINPDSYNRPAKLRHVLRPHFDGLIEHGVIDSVDYQRGGLFVFHVRNYLRSQLRRILEGIGVYAEAARQLVAGYDETQIMMQCDCLQHGSRGKPQSPGGFLTEAVREDYPLRYPAEEPRAFLAMWEMLAQDERAAYHAAGVKLCGVGDDLFQTRPDPTAWEREFRAVVRFMICHCLDPEKIIGHHPPPLLGGA